MSIHVVDKYGREKHADVEIYTERDNIYFTHDVINNVHSGLGSPWSGSTYVYPLHVLNPAGSSTGTSTFQYYYVYHWPFIALTSTLSSIYNYVNANPTGTQFFSLGLYETFSEKDRRPYKKIAEDIDNELTARYWQKYDVNWSGLTPGRMYWLGLYINYTSSLPMLALNYASNTTNSYLCMFNQPETTGTIARTGITTIRPTVPKTSTNTPGDYRGGTLPEYFNQNSSGSSNGFQQSVGIVPLFYGQWS